MLWTVCSSAHRHFASPSVSKASVRAEVRQLRSLAGQSLVQVGGAAKTVCVRLHRFQRRRLLLFVLWKGQPSAGAPPSCLYSRKRTDRGADLVCSRVQAATAGRSLPCGAFLPCRIDQVWFDQGRAVTYGLLPGRTGTIER